MADEKHHSSGSGKLLWFLVGTAAAGVAYYIWHQSQPQNDPWAEPWEKSSAPIDEPDEDSDSTDDSPDDPADSAA